MSEAEGALGQALEGDDWETVEKPSKANRRLAPQKPFTRQDFLVEKKSEAAPKPQGECVMRVAVCAA